MSRTGLLVMAYGTPRDRKEIAAFYTDIRRGRPPSEEQLAELELRYDAIGGVSPLVERARAQVDAIGSALTTLTPGRFYVAFGSKHGSPRLEEGVDELAAAGIDRLVGLVLAPHYSALSVGEYFERASARAASYGIAFEGIEQWHDDPVLVALLATRVRSALERLEASSGPAAAARVEVLFSAHSLPSRIVELGDPYPAQLGETARLVAQAVGIAGEPGWPRARTAWQSASRTGEPWLGPDLLEVLATLAGQGATGVVVCPAGFTSDHLEVLYDLDIVARREAERLGLAWARADSLNDDPALAGALARRVIAASSSGWS